MNHADVKNSFDLICRNFMLSDLRKGIDQATANYLVAMAIFSYLEVVGGLLTGDGATQGKSRKNFNASVSMLPKPYSDLDLKLTLVDKSGKVQDSGLYSICRCGFVHEYSAKGPVTVNSTPYGKPDANIVGVEVTPGGAGFRLVVNNNELLRDFEGLVRTVGAAVDSASDPVYSNVKAVFERMERYQLKV